MKGLVESRWRRFTFPNGRKRTFAPWKWEWRDRILVCGEFVAVCAAIAAVPVELSKWSYAPWLIIGAAIVGTSALLWYAFDLISAGESPLTNRSAHTIRQVIDAVKMEEEGVTFDWNNIDERGAIPSDMTNWSRLDPDLKAIMDTLDVPLMVAVHILNAQKEAVERE